jgi:cytochrome c-type biogenesis protein CcmH
LTAASSLLLFTFLFYVFWVGVSKDPTPAVELPLLQTEGEYTPLDKNQLKHFEKLLKEFRCVVCQNQSLADSSAPVAISIKETIYKQLGEGRSEKEIKTFLSAHYGDYILYNPPVKKETLFLWLGPFAFLLVALGFVWRIFIR